MELAPEPGRCRVVFRTALLAGMIADRLGMPAAIATIAAIAAGSGLVVLVRMRETLVRT